MKKLLLILFLSLALPLSVSLETKADIAADNSRDVYTGNGATTSFTYNFKILTSADIAVYQAGTLKTLTTHYTLTGVGNDAGGTVVFVTAPAADEQVLLVRSQAIEQTSSYTAGSVSAATIERDFDRQTAINQMQAEQIARTLRYPITTTPTTALTELPTPVADKCLGYDNAGTTLQMNDCTGGAGDVTTHAALTTAHGSTDANTASRIVQRDASGNFSAGTITANLTGNASTATALAANPANCTGSFPRGITAAGVTEDCDQVEAADIATNVVGAAAIDETDNYTFTGTIITTTTVGSLGTATSGVFKRVTDGNPDCSTGGGASVLLCTGDGSNWITVGGNVTTPTLDTVFDAGKVIDGANSSANAVKIGNGTVNWDIYCDATNTCYFETSAASDLRLRARTNQNVEIYDEEGAAAILTIDPDAASTLAMYTFGTAYKPKKSIWFGAGSLSTDGTQCAAPAEVTPVASGPKVWSIICQDNAASAIYGSVRMPDAWDGGTVTFTHVYQQTAADTGILNGDIACQARSNGEAPTDTYGTAIAIDDAAVVGSGANDMTTSAAVTCAGTGVAGGDMLYFKYLLSTDTTTAVATLHHLGFTMKYSVTSLSD